VRNPACRVCIGNRFNQSPGRSGSPEDRYQGMSSRSMDVSFMRRIALPYLTLVERRHFIETLDSSFIRDDRAESFPPYVSHPLASISLHSSPISFPWYCHNRFEIRCSRTRRSARRPRTSGASDKTSCMVARYI